MSEHLPTSSSESDTPESTYKQEVASFRAAVVEKFGDDIDDLKTLEDGTLYWQFFDLEKDSTYDGCERKYARLVILLTLRSDIDVHGVVKREPWIRLIYSENYSQKGPRAVECFTIDVSVDFDTCTQYVIDSYPLNIDYHDYREPDVPLVRLSYDNELLFNEHYSAFTSSPDIPSGHTSIIPFGTYDNINDLSYALGKAKELFDVLKDLEPAAIGTNYFIVND